MKKLIALVAALVMVSSFAYAADWNFYGSARMETYYTNTETIDTPGTADVKNTEWQKPNGARFGATVKVSDELTGGVEYGSASSINLRKLYGAWNFGSGTFTVGQTYSPLNLFYSDQQYGDNAGLLNIGGVYSGREQQLALNFGGFSVALVPAKKNVTDAGSLAVSTESLYPAIEAKYVMKMGASAISFAGGYQTYDQKIGTTDYSVDSYVLAIGAKTNFAGFSIGGDFFTGQNAGNLIAVGPGWGAGIADLDATLNVVDNDVYGGIIVLGYKLSDMVGFEVGYGVVKEELDKNGAVEDKTQSYYLQSRIAMAPGVFFVPEIGVIDGSEVGEANVNYYGASWYINF